MPQLVLSFIGNDRPGIIDHISTCIRAEGANWSSSRMCNLAGKFTGILLIDCPEANSQALINQLQTLNTADFTLVIEYGANEKAAQHNATIEVIGNDKPGIIKEIAALLAAANINVLELQSDLASAPMSGILMFSAQFSVDTAAAIDWQATREAIESIASDLMVEIKVH